MEPVRSLDIDSDNDKIETEVELVNPRVKPTIFTFKNIKKWVKYISYALILLLTIYTIFSNIVLKNDENKKIHDSKVDYAIKSLFKVVQLTNGMPAIGDISINENSNIEELGLNIDNFLNALTKITTTTQTTVS